MNWTQEALWQETPPTTVDSPPAVRMNDEVVEVTLRIMLHPWERRAVASVQTNELDGRLWYWYMDACCEYADDAHLARYLREPLRRFHNEIRDVTEPF